MEERAIKLLEDSHGLSSLGISMWCLPTHKRPEKLQRFIDSIDPQDIGESVFLMLWKDDPYLAEYEQLKLPQLWDVYVGPERLCRDKLNKAFSLFPDEKFYGLLTDDIVLKTYGILTALRRIATSGYLVWPDDGVWHHRMATHPVAPGDLIRALGFWAHPRFPHNGIDSVLYIVASELNLLHYAGGYKIGVTHPLFCSAPMDETYEEGQKLNEGFKDDYDTFLRVELYPLLKETAQKMGIKLRSFV